MAYIQRNIPAPPRPLEFSQADFSGGLNNTSEQLLGNQASDLMNMKFADQTLMENRDGQKYYDVLDVTNPITFIDEFKPYNDADQLVRATNTAVYFGSFQIATVVGQIHGCNFQGKYFFTDGNKFYVYGKFAQVTNTFEKVIGTPNPNYILLEVVSPAVGHPRLDTSYTQGVTNIDYTNNKIYYEPCENEFVDTYSGANIVPTSVKYITSHNGRLFVSGMNKDNDNVFISDIQNPFYFPVSLPMQLPPNSDMIVGLVVFDDSVIVGRHNDLYAIFGFTNRPDIGAEVFQMKRLNSHTGFANQDAINIAHNYLFFLGYDGNAYSLSSTRADERTLATSIISKNIDIRRTPINLTLTDVSSACSIFFNDEWYVSMADKILIYNYLRQAWTLWNQHESRAFYILNRELVWGTPDGRVGVTDYDNALDFGLPYKSYWYSKYYDMGTANNFKQFKEFFLLAQTYDLHASDIYVIFEVDYADIKDRFIVTNQTSRWGKSRWGDRFITRNINASLPIVIGRRGRTIRFKFNCGYFLDGEVATVNDLDSYPTKKDGLLVKVTADGFYYLYMDMAWIPLSIDELNQKMKIHQINGEYELRGKR